MPYKRKKQTPAHKKQLERVRQLIRRAEKRGFRFTDDFKSSLKDLKTVQLKALKPEKLYSLSTALSEVGDIVSGTERRREERSLSAKKSAQTRKKKKQQKEQEFTPPPDSISPTESGEIYFTNFLEEFIEKLQEPTPKYIIIGDRYRSKRPEVVETADREKASLLSLTFKTANEIGIPELGYRLEEHATEINRLIDLINYEPSDAQKIISASTRIAELILGRGVNLSERMDLGEQEEFNENWDEPE